MVIQKQVKKPVVVIVGPTAVGKTAISIRVARQVGGEIISADSRLLYIGMDIGTAKPSLEERENIPHHLIDVTTPDNVWSLADFQQAAKRIIDEIHARGALPILVGGTGQYIRSIVQGWEIPRVSPDKGLRTALEKWAGEIGAQELYERLAVLDPEAAAKIEPENVRRSIRALEVILTTGKLFSRQKGQREVPYRILQIGLIRPRKELYRRIDRRIELMLEQGFEKEVRRLLANGYSIDNPPMSAIGYNQMIRYIHGEISLEEAVMLMKRKTRVFVRRQANWFKAGDETIEWFDVDNGTTKAVVARIKMFLKESG